MSFSGKIEGIDDELVPRHIQKPHVRPQNSFSKEPESSCAQSKQNQSYGNASRSLKVVGEIYHEFLNDLDMSSIEVTDWEAQFIESNLHRKTFSPAQILIIKKLIKKYESKM